MRITRMIERSCFGIHLSYTIYRYKGMLLLLLAVGCLARCTLHRCTLAQHDDIPYKILSEYFYCGKKEKSKRNIEVALSVTNSPVTGK
jgi:hypothetical protein